MGKLIIYEPSDKQGDATWPAARRGRCGARRPAATAATRRACCTASLYAAPAPCTRSACNRAGGDVICSYAWDPHLFVIVFGKYYFVFYLFYIFIFEAGRGAEAQSVTVKSTGCRFDPHLRK